MIELAPIALLAVLVVLRTAVPIALGAAALVGFTMTVGWDRAPQYMVRLISGVATDSTMVAIPLVVFYATLMNATGAARRFAELAITNFGASHRRTALGTVLAGILYGPVAGQPGESARALGTLLGPRLRDQGYGRHVSMAILAAAVLAGCLAPPSVLLVLAAVSGGESLAKLWLTAVLPWALLASVLSAAVSFWTRGMREPEHGARAPRPRLAAWLASAWDLAPLLFLWGAVDRGFAVPAEGLAGLAIFACVLCVFSYGDLKLEQVWTVLVRSARRTIDILLTVMFANFFLTYLSLIGTPNSIADAVRGYDIGPVTIVTAALVAAVGFSGVLEPIAGILITLNLLLPAATQVGVLPTVLLLAVVLGVSIGSFSPLHGLSSGPIAVAVGARAPHAALMALLPAALAAAALLAALRWVPELFTLLPAGVF